MLKNKVNILLFLFLFTYLIFAKKIVIIIIYLINIVLISIIKFSSYVKLQYIVYRIKFSNNSIQILDTWHNIVLVIKKLKHFYYNILSNKFLEYEVKWNIVKMKYSSKCELEASTCFISFTLLLISEFFIQVWNYFISEKFSCRK